MDIADSVVALAKLNPHRNDTQRQGNTLVHEPWVRVIEIEERNNPGQRIP